MEYTDLELTDTKVASEELFRGKVVHLFRDTVRLPNGKTATRELLRHPGAGQMRHLKALRLSRPFFELRAAPELVADDPAAMRACTVWRYDCMKPAAAAASPPSPLST